MWKADSSAPAPSSSLLYTAGPGWWMEEETSSGRTRSMRIHESTLLPTGRVWMQVEPMPLDWVGEHVHDMAVPVPFVFFAYHPLFGRLDRIGDWMRWTTTASVTEPEDAWSSAQDWIRASLSPRTPHNPHLHHSHHRPYEARHHAPRHHEARPPYQAREDRARPATKPYAPHQTRPATRPTTRPTTRQSRYDPAEEKWMGQ